MENLTNKWAPVLRGRIYCSPGCGFNCTKKAHDDAVAKGKALCERLGPAWTPVVWENGGWHHKAVCGVLELHPGPPYYTAFLNASSQFIGRNEEPEVAVRDAMTEMRETTNLLERELEELESLLKPAPTTSRLIGRKARFAYPCYGTPDSYPEYTAHSGQIVTIIRQLFPPEVAAEVTMFEVEAEDGWKGYAHRDELRVKREVKTPRKRYTI